MRTKTDPAIWLLGATTAGPFPNLRSTTNRELDTACGIARRILAHLAVKVWPTAGALDVFGWGCPHDSEPLA